MRDESPGAKLKLQDTVLHLLMDDVSTTFLDQRQDRLRVGRTEPIDPDFAGIMIEPDLLRRSTWVMARYLAMTHAEVFRFHDGVLLVLPTVRGDRYAVRLAVKSFAERVHRQFALKYKQVDRAEDACPRSAATISSGMPTEGGDPLNDFLRGFGEEIARRRMGDDS